MHLPPPPSTIKPLRLPLLALAAGVALLHLALWHGVAESFEPGTAPGHNPKALQVRTVEPAPLPAALAEPVARTAKPAPPPHRMRPQSPAEIAATPSASPVEPVLVAVALPAQAMAEMTPVLEAAPDDVPVYRTTMPPAITLNYEMHRGLLSGTGELLWRPTADGYSARLAGRVAGFSILTWVSEGSFDAAGIAPLRYTDQRRGKDTQAANFQRQAGKISYSGPSTEYPLLQGTQDRLSWMIQIAAIASAEPKRLAPGSRVAMFVTGARGDADVWAFVAQGIEDVNTGDTTMRAVKLLREPRGAHDTRVEVWLAPSLHHLPVRARLSNDGSTLELRLQTSQPAS